MTHALASHTAPATWRPTTAQLVRRADVTKTDDNTAPLGISLHHFTDLVTDRIDLTALDLHRVTTVLTKQVRQALGGPNRFEAVRSLVIDPDRVATPDGRTAAEVCGESWSQIRRITDDRACEAIDGVCTFGEATVIQLAVLRATETRLPWWGTTEWELRVDRWAATLRFASRLKRAVRQTPEMVPDDVLRELIG